MKHSHLTIAKQITPPLIVDLIKRYKAYSHREFQTWDEALKESTGYENRKLIKLVFYKTNKYREKLSTNTISISRSETQTLTSLGVTIASTASEKITVVDFGGACGAHFFLAKIIFRETNFDWRVIETAEMVKRAKELESEELHFYTDIKTAVSDINTVHLVHTSGTLQCIPNPYQTLKELIKISADFMLCSRLGVVTELNPVITLLKHRMSTHGPGSAPEDFKDEVCMIPFHFPAKSVIESIISESYNIDFTTDDPSGRFSVGSHEIIGMSFFCRKRIT